MEFEHKSGIYMCTCSGNNKSYIGQAKDVKDRKCEYLSELHGGYHFNQYLQHSYDKYNVAVASKKRREGIIGDMPPQKKLKY